MHCPASRHRGWALVVLVAAVGAAGLLGCGDDDSTRPEAQPVPGASTFAEGNFDELPRYRGAEAVEDPVVEGDVTTQTFTTGTATPRRVMEFYERRLREAGWHEAEEVRRLGAEGTYRGVWRSDGQRLVVSATTFTGFDDPSAERTTQFSLSLGPTPE